MIDCDERLGHPLDPPVHADLEGLDPGEVLAWPPPQIVVVLLGDRPAVGISREALAARGVTRRGDRLG